MSIKIAERLPVAKFVFVILLTCMLSGLASSVLAQLPADVRAIGGHWYVRPGSPEVVLYEDAGELVDLFSYHQQDSNEDGIPNLRISHNETHLIIRSQGFPNHPTAVFPNSGNPNTIRVQDFTFRLPLRPKLAEQITRLPMGPIGMALNGVVFFNPFEAGGMNAVSGYSEVWLDSCCGHPQQTGVYHYHKYPSCLKSPFVDNAERHSPLIGFAFDGFPIYGPYESANVMAKDLSGAQALDVCNGHSDPERGYHYHVTPGRFPYILGGYSGVVEVSNNRGMGRNGQGAIQDNASGTSPIPAVIARLTPGTAARGKAHKIMIELQPDKAPRGLPSGAPSWVQIGPYEAKSIQRQGQNVTIEVDIWDDAALGVLLDCHMEFEVGGRRTVFKKNDAFRIVGEKDRQ